MSTARIGVGPSPQVPPLLGKAALGPTIGPSGAAPEPHLAYAIGRAEFGVSGFNLSDATKRTRGSIVRRRP